MATERLGNKNIEFHCGRMQYYFFSVFLELLMSYLLPFAWGRGVFPDSFKRLPDRNAIHPCNNTWCLLCY